MTDAALNSLIDAAARATPGDWETERETWQICVPEGRPKYVAWIGARREAEREGNMEFIAAANPSVVASIAEELLHLRKEASWLACELEKREHGCAWCAEYPDKCNPNVAPCGYNGPDNWRQGAEHACCDKRDGLA